MSFNRMAIAAVLLAGVSLSGCQSAQQALGLTKVTPDEFRVVAKAPLVVPPEFALRPPSPGEPRPQELQPESQARIALLGARQAEDRSEGEKLLASRAGADKADPLIRYVVDDEFGAIAHKEPSFADRVMFWKKDKVEAVPVANAPGAAVPAPINPSIEAQRIKKLTDGKAVIISRDYKGHVKLPGL
jgi:hypothetical protein